MSGGFVVELYLSLSHKWSDTCTLVQFDIPFTLAFQKPKPSLTKERQKQDLVFPGGSFDSHVYMDAIGVLDEFKARNKIATGFESALFWWFTINKKRWIGLTIFIIASRDLSTILRTQ
jgi:hypothetical protein